MKRNNGFTLIELLVVVAIIGILAAVVLASLNTSKEKAINAQVVSEMSSMRSQALLYSAAGSAVSLTSPCPTTSGIFDTANNGLGKLVMAINKQTNNGTVCLSTANNAGDPGGASWVIAVRLKSSKFCVDSTGVARDKTAAGVKYSGSLTGNPYSPIKTTEFKCQ